VRSSRIRAMVAASGALGGWVMVGHLVAVETVNSDPFLWSMVRMALDGQAPQPEKDPVHPDHR